MRYDGYYQTGVHGMLAARNIFFFSYYKLGGAKTGLEDGREFGSGHEKHIFLFS